MIRTSDGEMHDIRTDSDFWRLVRDYLGDEAADWYEDRIMEIDSLVRELRDTLQIPMDDLQKKLPKYGTVVTDFTKLEGIWTRRLADAVAVALDVKGWDES